MESVSMRMEDRHELDQLLVALLQRRDRLAVEDVDDQQIQVIDRLVGKINWDAAATELEVNA